MVCGEGPSGCTAVNGLQNRRLHLVITFVEQALREVRAKGFEVVSVDSIVLAEQPKIAPHKEIICQKIASMLSLKPGRVSVKGRTFEGMGEIGRGEAIAAQAIVVLSEST